MAASFAASVLESQLCHGSGEFTFGFRYLGGGAQCAAGLRAFVCLEGITRSFFLGDLCVAQNSAALCGPGYGGSCGQPKMAAEEGASNPSAST